jgi:NadR type nicotinamide-nucleotide adenylyltransferase
LIHKIAITGPESTGKTTLTESLGKHFNEPFVEEFARDYLYQINRQYLQADLLEIANGQINREEQKVKDANLFLFSDTELINMKIWSIHKYGNCHQSILDKLKKQDYSLYLLTDIDMPWEYDDLRENPDNREFFLDWFIKELSYYDFPYKLISGNKEKRLNSAIASVNALYNS